MRQLEWVVLLWYVGYSIMFECPLRNLSFALLNFVATWKCTLLGLLRANTVSIYISYIYYLGAVYGDLGENGDLITKLSLFPVCGSQLNFHIILLLSAIKTLSQFIPCGIKLSLERPVWLINAAGILFQNTPILCIWCSLVPSIILQTYYFLCTGCSTMEGGDGTADLVINKRFVSESELDERRKRRQEEWEKVRKPEDPEGTRIIA